MYQNINICFIWARVISDIKFEFFYNNKIHDSIVEFAAQRDGNCGSRKYKNQIIFCKAYDYIADEIYRKYKKESYIKIIGRITNKYIEIIKVI